MRYRPEQQRKAVAWGAAAAITMRIVLTFTAVALLTMPYLKLIGSVFLMWIGIQLLDSDEGESDIEPGRSLAAAIRTILFADMVMSLDKQPGAVFPFWSLASACRFHSLFLVRTYCCD